MGRERFRGCNRMWVTAVLHVSSVRCVSASKVFVAMSFGVSTIGVRTVGRTVSRACLRSNSRFDVLVVVCELRLQR